MAFEYIEKIYYLWKHQICLRNIFTKKDDLSLSHQLYPKKTKYDEYPERIYATLGVDNDKLIIVCKIYDKCWKMGIMRLNKELKFIKKEYASISVDISPITYLRDQTTIKHSYYSVIAKYGESGNLPHAYRIEKHTNCDHLKCFLEAETNFYVSTCCYDKYNDTLVIIYGMGNHECRSLIIWKKDKQKWIILRKESMYQHHYFSTFHEYLRIISLEASKNNYIFSIHAYDQQIIVIDKHTFELVDNFDGTNPVFLDDYESWHAQSLDYLKKLVELEKLNVSLLKIILSYI